MILRSLDQGRLRSYKRVKEYGTKQKGGAPRLFALEEYRSYFFLDADIEKGGGSRKIPTAIERADAILRISPVPQSLRDWETALGEEWTVELIPDPRSEVL